MVEIRDERPEDIDAIREVNRQAFGGDDEGRLVDALRARGVVLLSLVAVVDKAVVGHILFSPVTIGTLEGAGLAPMAVLPAHQRQGIGSQLVRRGLEHLRERRCPTVVVVGHPEFYPRFGFEPAAKYGLTCDFDVPPEVFMVAVLDPTETARVAGHVTYQAEFSAFA